MKYLFESSWSAFFRVVVSSGIHLAPNDNNDFFHNDFLITLIFQAKN